jgi:hypothetical protein
MSKRRKIILGTLTAWPLVYIFLFMAFVFSMMIAGPMMGEVGNNEAFGGLMAGGFGLVFVGHIGTMLLQFGLLGFFLYHVFKRKDLETNTQLLWALLIFMGGPIGQLIYWWKEIWSDDDAQPAAAGASANVAGGKQYGGRDGRL